MHPHTFYSTLFTPTKRDEVFVIMSFAAEFEPRWRDIIEPWICEDLGLKANRVDYNDSGESIVHDMMDGIAHSRLVVADITSTPMTDKRGMKWPQRNGNVMWELGVAHVMRTPDEVLVIRSDADPSLFDLTQFRAFDYDPHDPVEARRALTRLAKDRLRSAERSASDHVKRVAASLDVGCLMLLYEAALNPITHIPVGKSGPSLFRATSFTRLLELGLIRIEFSTVTQEMLANKVTFSEATRYEITDFGRAVTAHCYKSMGLVEG